MPHINATPSIESVTLLRTQTGGPGPRLRAAREALGLGLNDIAKRMRLKEYVIHQIEQDMYDENTALVFVKGYLRSYAGLVGLNPDTIIQDFISIGLSEDRDAPDLTKLIRKGDRPRRMSLPLNLQSNPAIMWSCAAGMALAIVGLMWAYSGSITSMGKGTEIVATQQVQAVSAPLSAPIETNINAPIQAGAPTSPAAVDGKLATQAKNAPAPAAASGPAPKTDAPHTEPLLF